MNEAILGKIKALLAKAASTEFPEEQAAFFAKAQELISRYAVDQALLQGDRTSVLTRRCVEVCGAYPAAQILLRHTLSKANGVFMLKVGYRSYRTVEMFGAVTDLDMVELLFGSVWAQLVAAAERSVFEFKSRRWDCSPADVRRWRSSFMRGYAAGVRDALKRANGTVASSSDGAALVLVDREKRAREFAAEKHEWTMTASRTALNPEALGAGHSAGLAASFATSALAGGRLALSS